MITIENRKPVANDNSRNHRGPLPLETGDWSEDTRSGREFADQFIARCDPDDVPRKLAQIAERIATSGNFEGVEVGFFTRIGELVNPPSAPRHACN